MIERSTIEQVKDLSIEEVIGRYLGSELKRAGFLWKAKCPFPDHGEKTASFYVDPKKNSFRCYGCGKGGDGLAFVMHYEQVSFIEAVRSLASQHGIEVKETKKSEQKTEEQKNEEATMQSMLHHAQKKFVELLQAK